MEEKNLIPEENFSDVPQGVEEAVTPQVNYAEMSLAQISALFESLTKAEDRMERYKEAEALKSAFYKKLIKEKEAAGYGSKVDEPAKYEEEAIASDEEKLAEGEAVADTPAPAEAAAEIENPFEAIEQGFKSIYNGYKKERADYNKQIEHEKEANLANKEAIIADLKSLVEREEEVNVTFPEFREIQDRWKKVGPVPAPQARNINDTYHFYVEKFYDRVSIDRELRDLDFKKNLELKEEFCAQAEKLAESNDVVESFNQLQKLHDQWKELGPVSKQYRESIWERFKAATAQINKKYQAHFEDLKAQFEANLAAKVALCEQVEEIASREMSHREAWNACAKEIEEIQKRWKEIGYATKKENQRVYDRFRAACDSFYGAKKEYYSAVKEDMMANYAAKEKICQEAEALKDSTEWQATTARLIQLQKEWKEIGAVPRKKSEPLWKRFRAACDAFFEAKEKDLKAKRAARAAKHNRAAEANRPQKNPKARLVELYKRKQQELATAENNIGFFANSKGAEALLAQMNQKIQAAKEELLDIENQIRQMEKMEEQNNG